MLDIRNNKIRSISEDILDAAMNKTDNSVYFVYYSKLPIRYIDYCSFCACKLYNVLEQNRSTYMVFQEHLESCCYGHEWKDVDSVCKLPGNKCDKKAFRSITCTNGKFQFFKPRNIDSFHAITSGNKSFSKTIQKGNHRKKASSHVLTYLGKQTKKKSRQNGNNKKEIDEAFNVGISFVFPGASILLSSAAYAIWRINKNRKKKKGKRNPVEDLYGNDDNTHDRDTRSLPSTDNQAGNRNRHSSVWMNIPEITVTSAEVFDMFIIPQIIITAPELSNSQI